MNIIKPKKPRPTPLSLEYVTYNDPFIKTIAKKISEAADEKGFSKAALAEAFVQSLSYVDDVYTGRDEYPKYPVETFFEKNGDCEDTSYLTASIVTAMNIDTTLIVLPGHMAVGVWMDCDTPGTSYKSNDRCYYYTETTGEGWLSGEIPDRYKYSVATLIKIPSGETVSDISPQYNKPCDLSTAFSGYYYDGNNYYSDSQCYNQVYCLSYKGYYVIPQVIALYWDSSCSQTVTTGCYKSKIYAGYFYKSGLAWYYDSACTQLYKSMTCIYPYSYGYSCTQEYQYTSKQNSCGSLRAICASAGMLGSPSCGYAACVEELNKCRSDINEYQSKLNEYNSCSAMKEY